MKTIFDILYLIEHIRNNIKHNKNGHYSTVMFHKSRFFELKSSPRSMVLHVDNNYYDERVFSFVYGKQILEFDDVIGHPSYTHCKQWYVNPVHIQFIDYDNITYDLKKILSMDEFNVQLMHPSTIVKQYQFSTELLKRNDDLMKFHSYQLYNTRDEIDLDEIYEILSDIISKENVLNDMCIKKP